MVGDAIDKIETRIGLCDHPICDRAEPMADLQA